MYDRNDRRRGIAVYPMPDEIGGPFDRYALLIRRVNGRTEARMVHTEGVAYLVNDGNAWTWPDYDPDVKKWTFAELISASHDVEAVDLADWVRCYNHRLEANFYQIVRWATEGEVVSPNAKPPAHCTCGDATCNCYCIPGEYPCEDGSAGEGC